MMKRDTMVKRISKDIQKLWKRTKWKKYLNEINGSSDTTEEKDLEIVQEKYLYIKKNIYLYIQTDIQRRKKRLKKAKSLSI